MLIMTTLELGPPVVFIIRVKAHDLAIHQADPLPRRPTGRHQKNMESDINQQIPDAITSGSRCLNSRPSAASTAAESIHNCARFIINKSTSLACQTADRPRGTPIFFGIKRAVLSLVSTFISAHLPADGDHLAAMGFEIDLIQRSRWRAVQNLAGPGVETSFVTRTLEPIVLFRVVDRT